MNGLRLGKVPPFDDVQFKGETMVLPLLGRIRLVKNFPQARECHEIYTGNATHVGEDSLLYLL